MKEKSYSQILDRVARAGLTANTDLTPRILAHIQKGKDTTMHPRTKVFVAAFLILLVLIIGLVIVPEARAAIQRWIGYSSGLGLVGEGQVRVLAEPVTLTRDGITLTVKELWAAPDRTLVRVSVEGWPWSRLAAAHPTDGCLDPAVLRIPERDLAITQPLASFGRATGYDLESLYPALPSTVDEVTFVMPCLILASPGQAPENWEVALRLVPAPPGAVLPVIEIPSQPAATPTLPPQTASADRLSADGISLVLDRAVAMDDGYLVYASIHYENSGLSWIEVPDPTTLHILDAGGQAVSYELDWEANNALEATSVPGQTAFALKTARIPTAGPLSFVLDSLSASVSADARFTFDPGPTPQPGQSWDLKQQIDLGHGQSVRLLKVTYNLTDGVQAWLSFELQSETGVTYVALLDKAHPLTGMAGGGGGGAFSSGPFTSDLYYMEPLPQGPLTVDITGISVYLPGHWVATWTPPKP